MNATNIYNTVFIEMDSKIVKNNEQTVFNFICEATKKYSNTILVFQNEIKFKELLEMDTSTVFLVSKSKNEIKFRGINKKSIETLKIHYNTNKSIVEEIEKIVDINNILFIKEFLDDKCNIDNVKMIPSMINKFFNKEEYSLELAKFINKNKNEKISNDYLKEFNKKFEFKINGFNEIFDLQTGGITFTDDEVVLLKEKNSNHLLFSLFKADVFENKLQYTYNKRDSIVLRGAENYYFNMCYLSRYTENEITSIKNKIITFLENANIEITNYRFDIYNKVEDLKCILAILDVIRNITTSELYYFTRRNVSYKSLIFLYRELKKDSLEYELYMLLKQTYKLIYNILFDDIIIDLKDDISTLINNSIRLEKEVKKTEMINLSIKTIRMWRETDYIIENVITIKEAFKEILKEEPKIREKGFNIFGANYGSIDLAILFEVIAEKEKIKNINSGNIIISSTYDEIYKKNCVEIENNNSKYISSNIEYNILIDDNIVSGKSFETAMYIISQMYTVPICGVVIRPPQINRVNQMYTVKNNSRINLKLFNTYIKGLKGKPFFSKLCDANTNESFLDGLDVFDEVKESVRRELYKNKLYEKGSFVELLNRGKDEK